MRSIPWCWAATVEDQPSAKPMILSDYAFMNGGETKEAKAAQEATGSMPILVVKDKRTKTLAASFVPEKGCETFAVKWFGAFLLRMEDAEVVNKSDGEPAIKLLKQKAAEQVGVASIPEESVPYDSKSNGEIESAVKEVKGMIRATKIALETNLGFQLERTDPMVAWIPRIWRT